MQPYDHFQGIQAFVRAVEHGSFSLASRSLGLSPSSVGKAVARLEARLGVRLFQRTTRHVVLTDEGAAFHESCLRALGELEQAEATLADSRQAPAGRVRVALPSLYGREQVLPVLLALGKRQPRLAWDIAFASRTVDLVNENFDLAVRIGQLEDSATLVARPLGEQHLCLCAAPAYLAARGAPDDLDGLAGHDCVLSSRAGVDEAWQFGRPGQAGSRLRHAPRQPHMRLGDLAAVRLAALAGAGLAQLPGWFVAADVQAGRLVPLLPAWRPDPLPIHLLWLKTTRMTARLRLVIDALLNDLGPLRA